MPEHNLSCYAILSEIKSSYDKTSTYLSLYDSKTKEEVGCIINRLDAKIFGNNDSYVLSDNTYTIYNLENKGQGSFSTQSVLSNNIATFLTPFQNKTGVLDGAFVTETNKVTVFGKPNLLDPSNILLDIVINY